ncbi:hypothetical protein P4O66_009674, partial [Electrophorus voltai]
NVQPPGSKASSPEWAHLLAVQMVVLDQQRQEIGEIRSMVHTLGQHVTRMSVSTEQRASSPVNPPVHEAIKGLIASPKAYEGDPKACEGFIVQCELFLGYQPRLSDQAKVSFVISRLTGKVRVWGAALVTNNSLLMHNYAGFIAELHAVFHHPRHGRLYRQSLLRLRQGLRSAADYAMEFQTLVAETCWNEPAQIDVFVNGLRPDLQAELACKQEGNTLNEVIHLAITFDRLLQERVSYKGGVLSAYALVDSEAAGNVMDWGFARKMGIKAILLPSSLSVQALDGGPGYISHVTPQVLLVSREGHMERISFFLLPGLSHSLTLGLPWLRAHNPQMLWAKNQILQWAPSCHRRCFPNKATPLQATSIESQGADKLVPIPSEYQDLE